MTDSELESKIAHFRKIHGKEIGFRVNESIALMQEILQLRHPKTLEMNDSLLLAHLEQHESALSRALRPDSSVFERQMAQSTLEALRKAILAFYPLDEANASGTMDAL